MKPTVSVTIAVWPSPSLTWRDVGSSVANSLSSAFATSLPDERVEQRRLAGVRVADDADRRHSRRSRPRAAVCALLADAVDPLLHLLDPVADDPPVRLQLALAGSAGADAALGARQVGPQPRQARQLVLELGELDLEPALVGLGVQGEDVEDQPAAVDDLDLEQAPRAPSAGSGESSSSATRRSKPVSLFACEQLLGLALADVPVRVDVAAVLPLGADDLGAGRGRQVGELGQGVLGGPARRRRCRRRRGRPSRRVGRGRSSLGGSWEPKDTRRPVPTRDDAPATRLAASLAAPASPQRRGGTVTDPRSADTTPLNPPDVDPDDKRAQLEGTAQRETRIRRSSWPRSTIWARSATPRSTRASSRRASTRTSIPTPSRWSLLTATELRSGETSNPDVAAEDGRGVGAAGRPAGRRGRRCARGRHGRRRVRPDRDGRAVRRRPPLGAAPRRRRGEQPRPRGAPRGLADVAAGRVARGRDGRRRGAASAASSTTSRTATSSRRSRPLVTGVTEVRDETVVPAL